MADTIGGANIELGADATKLVRGMAEGAAASKEFDKTIDRTAKNFGENQTKMERDAERAARTAKLQADGLAAYINRVGQQAGLTRSQYLENRAIEKNIIGRSDIQESLAKLKQQEQGVASLGVTSKQTAQAMRLLPAQITDIVTSLISGQPAYLVAIQQGGQLKDMFGGIGNAAKALGGSLLGMAGMLATPIGAIGALIAALGGLFIAFRAGEKESDGLNQALIMSGNYAGTTTSAMNTMARQIAAAGGTQSQAAEALRELASTGQIASRQFLTLGTAAVSMNRTTGAAVKDTVAQFVELGKNPVEASKKLNEQFNYLTADVYKQIVALKEQGRTIEAGELAQRTFAEAAITRGGLIRENLGYIQRAWNAVAGAAKGAWDAIMNVGRSQDVGQQLENAQKGVNEAQKAFDIAAKAAEQDAGGGRTFRNPYERGQTDQVVEGAREQLRLAIERRDALVGQQQVTADLARMEGERAEVERGRIERMDAEEAFEKKFADYRKKRADAIKAEEAVLKRKLTDTEMQRINEQFPARDDAAERALQDRSEVAARLKEELGLRQKVGTETRKYLEFLQEIKDIQAKPADERTTDDQRKIDRQKELIASYKEASDLEKKRDAAIAGRKKEEKKPPEVRDSAATKMLQSISEGAAVLREELGLQEKLGAWEKKRVEFNQQILDIMEKSPKLRTKEDWSLLAAKEEIDARLKVNAELEKEKGLRDKIKESEEKAAKAAAERLERMTSMREQIEATQAARDEQSQNELEAFGKGDRELEIVRAERALRQEYERNKRTLSRDRTKLQMSADEYETSLKMIEDALDTSLERHRKYYEDLKVIQADPAAGARRAVNNYIASAENVAGQMERAFTTAFSAIEDAFVGFATTGKFEWQQLADAIIGEITRMMVKMAMLNAMKGLMGAPVVNEGPMGVAFDAPTVGAGFGSQNEFMPLARASGGPVNMGQPYMVGERGPELFTPRASGAIARNGGVSQPIVQHINIGGGVGQSAPERDTLRRVLKDGVRQGLIEANQRNSVATR